MPGASWRAGILLAALALLAACGGKPIRAPVGEHSARPAYNPGYHVVRRGDTLYSVAFQYGYDFHKVARWNAISPPYTIYVGQKLRVTPPTGPAATAPVPAPRPEPAPPPRRATSPTPPPRSVPAPEESRAPRWQWPTSGKLIAQFRSDRPGKKGIDIAGRAGQAIKAAADGRVVYSGSGLVGYGRLIIIKHNKNYLSAYAHNRRLLVNDGDAVRGGQVIAEMGASGTDRTMLHFEIRRDGNPVNPLTYLPKR